jgi:hypothetical protein
MPISGLARAVDEVVGVGFLRLHETDGKIAVVGRVARFFLVQNTKMGKNIPNDRKIDQDFPMQKLAQTNHLATLVVGLVGEAGQT